MLFGILAMLLENKSSQNFNIKKTNQKSKKSKYRTFKNFYRIPISLCIYFHWCYFLFLFSFKF